MTQTTEKRIFPPKRTEEAAVGELRKDPVLYSQYRLLEDGWRKRFIDYCTGKKTLPVTYDPFFKRIFNPDVYPERMSRFLSSIMGQEVTVLRTLPGEETTLDGGALLIMDILVRLVDGSLVNVEVQKVPYQFPGERMSCYSSDLLLRQYSQVRGEKGKDFTYRDLKKVYVIVIFEKSEGIFHKEGIGYIHHGKTVFHTGLQLELLQEFHLVALDVFRKTMYSKGTEVNERNGWLSFLSVEDVDEAEALLTEYPWLEELYRDMADCLHQPKEVLGMFSEALRMLDRNTVQYMIDEQKKEIEQQKDVMEQQKKAIEQQQETMEQQQKAIEQQQKAIEQQQKAIEQQQKTMEQQQIKEKQLEFEIETLKKRLAEYEQQE